MLKARERNGRNQRGPMLSNGQPRVPSPTEVRRLRDAALRGMKDAVWGTELGRQFMLQHISATMLSAGLRWTQDAARWRHTLGVFPVRTASLERGHSHPADPDSPEGMEIARRDRNAQEAFCGAHSALVDAGAGAERAVEALCERNEAPTFFDRICARAGLSALATYYGLTNG